MIQKQLNRQNNTETGKKTVVVNSVKGYTNVEHLTQSEGVMLTEYNILGTRRM